MSRDHLWHGDADRSREWVVCSVDRNRAGASGVDLELRTHLNEARRRGAGVGEALIDDPRARRVTRALLGAHVGRSDDPTTRWADAAGSAADLASIT